MNTASQAHQSTLNTESYEHQSTMNEANQVNTNRMNTATSMQTSQHNYNNNNYSNGNYNSNGHYNNSGYHNSGNPYGGCCWGSSNNGSSGSNVGAALGGMAVGAMVASVPREAAPVYAPGSDAVLLFQRRFRSAGSSGRLPGSGPPCWRDGAFTAVGCASNDVERRHILRFGVYVLRTCLQQWRGRLQSRSALRIDSAPVATKVDRTKVG